MSTARKSVTKPAALDFDFPGYEELHRVLHDAFLQAAEGKGHQRHGRGTAFVDQPMQTISDLLGSSDGMFFQAIKKLNEARNMPTDAKIRELYGVIIYTCGIILREERKAQEQ